MMVIIESCIDDRTMCASRLDIIFICPRGRHDHFHNQRNYMSIFFTEFVENAYFCYISHMICYRFRCDVEVNFLVRMFILNISWEFDVLKSRYLRHLEERDAVESSILKRIQRESFVLQNILIIANCMVMRNQLN
jgi:hypothetical protein